MKKLLSLKTLVLLLASLSCALAANAYDRYDYSSGLYYNTMVVGNEEVIEITYDDVNNTHYSGSITVPSEINIGAFADCYCPVWYIGENAFADCPNLTSISFPTTLKTIGSSAFSYCTSLTYVVVPYSVTHVYFNAFGDCANLRTVYIGSGVTYIGSYGFDSPLTTIEAYPYNPPTINNSNAFRTSTYNDAVLVVPEGRVSAYKNATYWSNFKHIRSRNAVPINATNFPDQFFRNALLSLYPDGYISDIATITSLDVQGRSISNLTGIELFTGLQTLNCSGNNLTSLDLSSNTNLTTLKCYNNKLTSLSVNNCRKITYLDCAPNKLTSLNLSNLTALETLYCYDNLLTSLTLADNTPNLEVVLCNNNKFTSLSLIGRPSLWSFDVSGCTSLKYLYCYRNALTSFKVTGNTALEGLYCYENDNLTAITGLNDCTAMTYLDCEDCKIMDLSAVNNMTYLKNLLCRNNDLTSLSISNKSHLEYVRANGNRLMTTAYICSNSALTELYINRCTALTELKCYRNDLLQLDVSGNTAMKTLECYYNYNLAAITDLASCKAITYLDCEDCKISDLSAVNGMTNIELLWARNNQLTTLTVTGKSKLNEIRVSGNTLLTTLQCNGNALTDLNVSNCTALKTLNCSSNSSLYYITNLADCIALTSFNCNYCNFSSLDVSALTKLTRLECRYNQLTTLNVTPLTALAYLSCSHNRLTSLNVSGKTALTEMYCYANQLTSLNIQGCSSLKTLYCDDNKLTSLYVQGCSALKNLYCYQNKINGDGMTTLVSSLPTCPSSNPGYLYAVYSSNEENTMTPAQITTAQNKNWNVKRHNGSGWVDMTATVTGDANGDGVTNISDVTALIDYVLSGSSSGVNLTNGDVNGDGVVNISDVTAIINYVLTGAWE